MDGPHQESLEYITGGDGHHTESFWNIKAHNLAKYCPICTKCLVWAPSCRKI